MSQRGSLVERKGKERRGEEEEERKGGEEEERTTHSSSTCTTSPLSPSRSMHEKLPHGTRRYPSKLGWPNLRAIVYRRRSVWPHAALISGHSTCARRFEASARVRRGTKDEGEDERRTETPGSRPSRRPLIVPNPASWPMQNASSARARLHLQSAIHAERAQGGDSEESERTVDVGALQLVELPRARREARLEGARAVVQGVALDDVLRVGAPEAAGGCERRRERERAGEGRGRKGSVRGEGREGARASVSAVDSRHEERRK